MLEIIIKKTGKQTNVVCEDLKFKTGGQYEAGS